MEKMGFKVSILVLVEPDFRRVRIAGKKWTGDMVSILVLVEPDFRQKHESGWERNRPGFNPCFSGT